MSDNKRTDDEGLEIDSIGTDDSVASATPTNPAPADEAARLKDELDRAKKEYLYLLADFENYKSHVIKERSDLVRYGAERLIVQLLDVLDNFDRALSFEITAENVKQFQDGMKMTSSEMLRLLERFGVKEVDSLGQAFNPSLHEALSSEETDRVSPGHISRVFKKAYKLHDRVIRPAQVVVAKEPSNKPTSGE